MSDIFDKVSGEQDFFKKLLSKVPGFKGYIERGNRRMSDKLVREKVASEFETLYARVSSLQRDLISQGGLEYVDDLEAAAIKLRQFIDRVKQPLTAMQVCLMQSRSVRTSSPRSMNMTMPCWRSPMRSVPQLTTSKHPWAQKDWKRLSATWSTLASNVWMLSINALRS